MQKRIYIIISMLFTALLGHTQIATGTWRIHSQSKNARSVVHLGNTVYTAFDAALLEYDTQFNESAVWDLTSGLSDLQLRSLGVHAPTNSILIGYQSGNLDLLKNNRVVNIPGIKMASIIGEKKVNVIKSNGNLFYVATGFGIVIVDPNREEIKDTYYPSADRESIDEITFDGDTIYAMSATRLYKANLNNPALADYAQWTVDSRLPILTNPDYWYSDVEVWQDSLYFTRNYTAWGHDSLFVARYEGNRMAYDLSTYGEINELGKFGDYLSLSTQGIVALIRSDYTNYIHMQKYADNKDIDGNEFTFLNEEIWIADKKRGLNVRRANGTIDPIAFEGPADNRFFAGKWDDGCIALVSGAFSSNSELYFPPTVMFFEKEKWSSIERDSQPKWSRGTHDINSVTRNPLNKDVYAVSSFSEVPLSLIDKSQLLVTDTFTYINAPFTRYVNGSTYITSTKYDANGNLWVLNGHSNQPLKMLSAEGNWKSFSLGSSAANRQSKKLFIDYNNTIWASFTGTGLIGYKPGDDVNSASDDKVLVLNSGEYTGALPSNNVTAVAMDFDNELWIGTDTGFGILYNTEAAFDGALGSYNVQRPKVKVGSLTNYVLENVYINDIEVDGGNRKWLATGSSGMILMSADGSTILEHFTTENSPLVSNTIIDLEIDHSTGEIFIITPEGLMSYRGDATYEDPEYSDVKIFPNPARPDFDGLITIQGIRFDSDVKVTDVAGNVVYKTTSNGGTATWNGKNLEGEKVASGVYLFWTASNITKGRFVGKVVVVN